MSTLSLSVLGGLAAGALHVVSGPDHLAALAPLAVHDRGRALRVGAAWGMGHGTGVVALGLLGQLLRESIDIQLISAWSEFLVGFLLVGMGTWAVRAALRLDLHAHAHTHDDGTGTHSHLHVHTRDGAHDASAHRGHTHAAFLVGTLHGSAGGGHLLGVLPSLAMSPQEAALYLTCYLIAAVAAMSSVGLVLGFAARRGSPRLVRGMLLTSALAAVLIGIWWIGGTLPTAAHT